MAPVHVKCSLSFSLDSSLMCVNEPYDGELNQFVYHTKNNAEHINNKQTNEIKTKNECTHPIENT